MNAKFAAAIAAMIWGTTYIVVALFLPHNPIFIAAGRALVGGLPLMALYHEMPKRDWIFKILVLGTLNVGVAFAFLFIAVQRLPAGVAGTLQSLGPIFTVLIAWPLLGQIPTKLRLGGVIFGAVGVTILLTSGLVALDWIGAAAGVCAAISLALGGVLLNRWGRPAPLLVFTAWQLVVGGVELAALALLTNDIPSLLTTPNVLAFAYLGLAGTAAAYALWFGAIQSAGASAVAPFFLLIPVVAFSLDALIRGVVPTSVQLVGAVIVLASLFVTQQQQATPKPAA